MVTLRDYTSQGKGETREVHICYKCDSDLYPYGKPIIDDEYARKEKDGSWTCGECVFEDLNKRKIQVLGPDHPETKQIISSEDNRVKRWNRYAHKLNRDLHAGLKYKKNRYTGRIPF
jgi:hypothetical protein